jgi:hypothetical protein
MSLVEILRHPDCTLIQLLNESELYPAYHRQLPDLIHFLVSHADEVVAIALGVAESSPAAKSTCRRILVLPVASFSHRVALFPPFVATVNSFLLNMPHDRIADITTCCLIVQYYAKLTAGNFLLQFPDGVPLFERLLDFISLPCVYDLVLQIVSDGHDRFADYLNQSHIAGILWERYQNSGDAVLLGFLANVVTSVGPHSSEIQYVTEPERIEIVFRLATLSEDRPTCNNAMIVLYELCSYCDEDDNSETSVLVRVFGYIREHQDELAAFVCNHRPFCYAKTRAIELFSALTAAQDSVPQSFFEAAAGLFTQMFENPQFSVLHCTAVSLFALVMQGDEEARQKFEDDFHIKDQIIREFSEMTPDKLYYGHLLRIVELLEEADEGNAREHEWVAFLTGRFAEMKTVAGSSYGGPRPQKGIGKIILSDDEDIPKNPDPQ